MHSVEFWICDIKDAKETEQEIDEYVKQESDYGGGLYSPIKWLNQSYATYEDAREHMRVYDTGNYRSVAVKYYDFTDVNITSAMLKKMQKKWDTDKAKLDMIQRTVHYKDCKSEFVSCKNCQSKISRRHITSNFCPVCRADMRPQSVVDKQKVLSEQLGNLEKKIKAEEKKLCAANKSKSKLKWLIRFEFHC